MAHLTHVSKISGTLLGLALAVSACGGEADDLDPPAVGHTSAALNKNNCSTETQTRFAERSPSVSPIGSTFSDGRVSVRTGNNVFGSNGDRQVDMSVASRFFLTPAASRNSVSARVRVSSAGVEAWGAVLGGGDAGVSLRLDVTTLGGQALCTSGERVLLHRNTPIAYVSANLSNRLETLSCAFDRARNAATNIRARLTVHAWAVAGGPGGASAFADTRVEGITHNHCIESVKIIGAQGLCMEGGPGVARLRTCRDVFPQFLTSTSGGQIREFRLGVGSRCLQPLGSVVSSRAVGFDVCRTGVAEQSWTHSAQDELSITVGGRRFCLEAALPAGGFGANFEGQPLRLATCTRSSNQKWLF